MRKSRSIERLLYKIIPLILFLLVSTISIAQKKKYSFFPENNSRLRYTWGLPNFEDENAISEAAKKFNYSYFRVAGCMIDLEFKKDCEKHNKKLDRRIIREYGHDWKERFNQEADRLYKLFRFADTVVMQNEFFFNEYFKEQDKQDSTFKATKTGDFILRHFEETGKDSVLLINLVGSNSWVNENRLVIYKKFELDLITKTVSLLFTKKEGVVITSSTR